MTAPQPAPGSDSVRAQIAEALREAMDERTYEQMTVCPNGCSCRKQTDDPDAHDCGCAGPCCMAVDWWDGRTDAEAYADVLVPLVDSLRAEAKAEALRRVRELAPFTLPGGLRVVEYDALRVALDGPR